MNGILKLNGYCELSVFFSSIDRVLLVVIFLIHLTIRGRLNFIVKQATIQDFPLRGNTVYLHVKRRRWFDNKTKQVVQRDWQLVAQGTRMTEEFAAFLKEISRY